MAEFEDDWMPSTEQVRSHYVFDQTDRWQRGRGEAFDRWLAAHDAEVRKSVDPEMAMPCADTKPHAAHVWQMSATGFCLCAGVVAEEPEWEYRAVAWELDTEDVYDSTRPAPSAGEAIDIATAQRLLDSNADMPALVIGVQRRRKAGPWVPVKQEGAET